MSIVDRLTPHARLILGALMLVFAFTSWQVRQPAISTGEDDAEYVMLGRALQSGTYDDLADVARPLHTRYPPAYPAALAAATAIGGERPATFAVVSLAWALASLVLLFAVTKRVAGAPVALVACVLTALNPSFLRSSSHVMSEAQFTALLLASLWAGTRSPSSSRHELIAGGAAILAALTRTIGITIIAALLLDWILRRRYRSAAALAVGSALTVGAWLLVTVRAPEQYVGDSYIADAASIASASRLSSMSDTSERAPNANGDVSAVSVIVRSSVENAWWYVTQAVPWRLGVPLVSNTPIDNVAWVAVLGVLVGFGLYLAWRQARLVAIALACYSGLLLIWRWRVDRFLEPLLPVLLAMIVCAAVELGRRFVRPQVAWVPAALVAVLIGGATLIADARTVAAARRCDRRNPNASPACVSPIDRSFFAAVSYIGRTDSVTAPIVTPKEHTLSYYTGRSIIPLRRYLAVPAESSIDSLRKWGVNELIVAPMGPVQPRMFDRARAVCGGLIPVRTFGNDVLLFRLREPEEPVDPASCALVRGLTPVW